MMADHEKIEKELDIPIITLTANKMIIEFLENK